MTSTFAQDRFKPINLSINYSTTPDLNYDSWETNFDCKRIDII